MSLQLVSSFDRAALADAQAAADAALTSPPAGTVPRLAAIWALRLALDSEHSDALLRRRERADDLLAVIGPWVPWPTAVIQRFQALLQRKRSGSDPWMVAEEGDHPVEDSWPPSDWKDLADPFCAYAAESPNAVRQMLRATLTALQHPPLEADEPLLRNVDHLSALLRLEEADRALLRLGAVVHESPPLRELLACCRYQGMQQAARVLGAVLQIAPARVLAGLRKSSPLRRNGLFDPSHHLNDLEDLLSLAHRVSEVISFPHPSLESLMQGFLRESRGGQLEAADYSHLSAPLTDVTRLLVAALRQRRPGVNLLLYGPPGTGKTEFAKLVAARIGARLFEVRSSDEDGDAANVQERMLGYRLVQSFLSERQDALVLFDEVEPVLGGDGLHALARLFGVARSAAGQGKAWLNQTLETNPVPAVWVANDIGGFDPAYLRRFFYTVEFKVPPRSVRRRIVGRHLDGLDLGPACLNRLADLDEVSPAQFGQVAQLLELVRPDTREEHEALLSRALEAGMTALGQRPTVLGHDPVTGYSLDFLNVDGRFPIERIIRAARASSRLSLCLFGPPGTGKTQLAHHLAHQLDRPLLAKRASDLLDRWVGATEQNLRAMFQHAQDDQAVLLLDEADSLLQDRAGAVWSWEVTQVNELLQQMEAFDGMFLCATNRFEHLDPAALRRFSFKLRFDYLTPEQRWRLFLQETGGSESDVPTVLRCRLDRLDTLTPGDFATVQRQCRALGETLSPAQFLDQLEEEVRLKEVHDRAKPIGFVQ